MITKRILFSTIVVAAAFTVVMPTASADFRVKLSDSYSNSRGGGHGGEFLVQQVAGYEFDFNPVSLGETPNRFEVFCLERTEYIGFGTTYVVELSDRAKDGGGGADPNPPYGDPLSEQTAYLYSQFITGNLAGYAYGETASSHDGADGTYSRTESANALQNVIWQLEDEIGGYSDLNADELVLASGFLADAQANAGLQQFDGQIEQVMVMNLSDLNGVNRQDQIIMVPAPGAVTLGILGLGMLSAFRRRNSSL